MEKFNEEYKRRLGNLIRSTRESKGLSQIQLAEEGARDEDLWICSVRYLRDLEYGKIVPSRNILEKLMDALDIDIAEWDREQYREVRVKFDNECEEIIGLIFDIEYTQATDRYLELTKEEYYDRSKLHFNQCLKYLEASLLGLQLATGNKESLGMEDAYLMAIEALKLSKPNIKKTWGDVDKLYIEQNVFNLLEYRLINLVADYTMKVDRTDEAIKIYKSAMISVDSEFVDHTIKRKIIPLLSFNLSSLMIENSEEYEEALEVCEEGIYYSSIRGISDLMPHIKYNLGRALWCLDGDNYDSRKYFKESVDIFELMGDTNSAKLVRLLLAQYYDIVGY